MFFVYILLCSDGSFYVGQTRKPARRLARHGDGTAAAFTRDRRPVRLVWTEAHHDRTAATRRERQIKGWSHAKKGALIRRDLRLLQALSKRRN